MTNATVIARRRVAVGIVLGMAALVACKNATPAGPDAGTPSRADAGSAARPIPRIPYDPDTLLGGEVGIDHVGIAVRDLAAATRVYTEVLGFGLPQHGKLPTGIQNTNFFFAGWYFA